MGRVKDHFHEQIVAQQEDQTDQPLTCGNCTAWLQLLARWHGSSDRGVQAACLNPDSPRHVDRCRADQSDWPTEGEGCSAWTRDPKFYDLI